LLRLDFQNRLVETASEDEIESPFQKLEGLNADEVRETAYEIFFTSCRSSPGFGGRHALTFYSNHDQNNGGSGDGGKVNQVVTKPTSRVKRALGLRLIKRSTSRRIVGGGVISSLPSSPVGGSVSPISHTVPPFRPRRPMTAAEIMRQQMRVTEHDDNKLRKTLMRTLVGQVCFFSFYFSYFIMFMSCNFIFLILGSQDAFRFLAPEAINILKRVQKVVHNNVVSPTSVNVVF
jgi:hypothetical protein